MSGFDQISGVTSDEVASLPKDLQAAFMKMLKRPLTLDGLRAADWTLPRMRHGRSASCWSTRDSSTEDSGRMATTTVSVSLAARYVPPDL